MSAAAPKSKFEVVKTFLERIERQIASTTPYLLHYDPTKQDLRPWLWPIEKSGRRIEPGELETYLENHALRAPACLCAVLDGKPAAYVEGVFQRNRLENSHKVRCARNRCGYLVALERFYAAPTLPLKVYKIRVESTDKGSRIDGIPMRSCNPKKGPPTTFGLLMQLDDAAMPGVHEDVFVNLFTQCNWCHWVTTNDAFHRHTCVIPPADENDWGNASSSDEEEMH